MVVEVVVNVITPVLEFCVNVPDKVAKSEPVPALGAVWLMVKVKLVGLVIVAPDPVTAVWISPKLVLVGVLSVVATPVKVKRKVFAPVPKTMELVPLPDDAPGLVKAPVVLKVTGSAFTCRFVKPTNTIAATAIKRALVRFFMLSSVEQIN